MEIRKKNRAAAATPATPAPTAPAKKPEPPPRFPGIILREMAPDTSLGAVVRLMVELDAQARVCGFWFETLGSNESDAGMAAMRVGMLAVEEERRCY